MLTPGTKATVLHGSLNFKGGLSTVGWPDGPQRPLLEVKCTVFVQFGLGDL